MGVMYLNTANLVAFTLLFLGSGLVFFALCSDFWSEHTSRDVPKFESFLLILDGISLILALNSLIFGLCACNNKCAITILVVQIVMSGTLSALVTLIYYENNKAGATFPLEVINQDRSVPIHTRSFLSWSFFMSFMGSALQLLSALFYVFAVTCCRNPPEKRRSRSRSVRRPPPRTVRNEYVMERELMRTMAKPQPPSSPVPAPPKRFQPVPVAPVMTMSDVMNYYEDIVSVKE